MHTDVCYIDTKSHAGSQYFVIFIDDDSRKLWASVLKTKVQALSVFKELQERAEREIDWKLKAVRADKRRISRIVQRIMLSEGNSARVHRAEDARAQWYG